MHVFDELLDDAERDEWQSLQQVSELVVRNSALMQRSCRGGYKTLYMYSNLLYKLFI